MRSLVVLPTYNEAANVEKMLGAVRSACPKAHVLVVDDASPDGTADLARAAALGLEEIDIVVRPGKDGLGNAYKAGFAWGLEHGYDAMVEMDCDFSHDPNDLVRLLAPLEAGDAELVIGSRYVPGGAIPNWSTGRRLLSRAGNVYANYALGLHVEDSTAGFRAYARSLLERIDLSAVKADSYGFQVEMTYLAVSAGATVIELPIRFVDRVEGDSKMSRHTVTEALLLVTALAAKRLVGLRPRSTARTSAAPGLQ